MFFIIAHIFPYFKLISYKNPDEGSALDPQAFEKA